MSAKTIRLVLMATLVAATVCLAAGADAQQPPQRPPTQPGGAPANPAPKATSRPSASAPKSEAGEAGQSDSQLRQRVDQLEEQLVDMQVVIGTLETLAKTGAGSGLSAPISGSAPALVTGQDAGRIEALETQVRALTVQLEQLTDQIRSLERQRAEAPMLDQRGPRAEAGSLRQASPQQLDQGGFGATVVTPGSTDPIGQLLSGEPRGSSAQTAAAPPFDTGGPTNPKQLYETAYGYLLQQNYPAAEAAFDDFLKRYPNDEMAANAQYWLGETYFARGQYKAAAGAFLKGSRSYAKSVKAPDTLLKLAMSLGRMGQKDAACQAYSELNARFPNPPAHIKDRVQSERQRVGCP